MSLHRKLQLLIATVFFFTLLLGSFVFIYIPSARLESTDQLTLFFGISILLILSLMATALVLYVLRMAIGPLEELTGDLSVEYSPDTHIAIPDAIKGLNNEIGAIARAIEKITQVSSEQYHTLEDKIQRRTKAMEESKAKDEAIIKNIAEGLVVTDIERRITFANPSAEKMLGYKLYELFERVWPDFLLVKDKQKEEIPLDRLAITRALKTNKPVSAEIGEHSYLMRKNGAIFPVLISAAPITIGDQQLGAVIVFRDVEKEIEVDKTKTEFVSLASHQLRTPLSTINWYVETILAGDVGDLQADQRPYFEQIYESTQRMIDLVNALLNVSRLEMGTFMVEPEDVKLDELVGNVLEELEPKLLSKEIKLTKDFDEEVPVMKLDQQLMWIILQN
ncbi:PAS domain S-box protein, partial [candidate division WWE3 bacterium]|nr:PAS domain S-box protein [candidate division WWE3 bacterium]